jgi:hypothetical protein
MHHDACRHLAKPRMGERDNVNETKRRTQPYTFLSATKKEDEQNGMKKKMPAQFVAFK